MRRLTETFGFSSNKQEYESITFSELLRTKPLYFSRSLTKICFQVVELDGVKHNMPYMNNIDKKGSDKKEKDARDLRNVSAVFYQ